MKESQRALIDAMVLMSSADGTMRDIELARITEIVSYLPVFRGLDPKDIQESTRDVLDILSDEDGLDRAMGMIRKALPDKLHETAYALAVEVASADGRASQEELRLLEMFRDALGIDRLSAAAIERGARARHMTA